MFTLMRVYLYFYLVRALYSLGLCYYMRITLQEPGSASRHWRISGGAPGARPNGPKSFQFHAFFFLENSANSISCLIDVNDIYIKNLHRYFFENITFLMKKKKMKIVRTEETTLSQRFGVGGHEEQNVVFSIGGLYERLPLHFQSFSFIFIGINRCPNF